jgi:hypothetical protein
VARLVKEDGVWKMDVFDSVARTLRITKGKDGLGCYDGTKEWWK